MTLSRSLRTGALLGASIALAACGAQNSPAPPTANPLLQASAPEGAAPVSDDAAYQGNVEHTGDIDAPLRPPLRVAWSVNLGGSRGSVGYPVVARGIVVVASGGNLLGLDAKTGKTLWSQGSPSNEGWVGPAYDDGAVFADAFIDCGSGEQGLFAFDERTGKQLWSATPPDQCEFSSPPTAASGVVYTAAAADGGDVYAYRESNGVLEWMASVENGDDSSPVVTSAGIYVSYACPQTYDFKPSSGKQIWHFSGPCEGGGGSTPVLYHGLLFVGDSQAFTGYDGLFFTAKNGRIAGGFNSNFPPAFAQRLGYFVTNYSSSVDTLEAREVPSMHLAWKAALNGDSYVTPPFVVGDIVYIETQQGNLFGYDAKSGKQKLDMSLGSGGYYRGSPVGLGYGSGELIVPNGAELIALKGS
jgi:outer membrane protein assembly factor BamB